MVDRTICLLLGGFWLAVATPCPADDTAPSAGAVERLLNAGFQDRTVPLAELSRAYQQERTQVGRDDPYLQFAYALVLAKNFQQGEVMAPLRGAAESVDPVVLPAREELVRLQLREGKYRSALEMLVDLAEATGGVPAEGPAGEDARRTAHWIGRIIVYLEGPLGQERIALEAKAADVPLRRLLGEHETLFEATWQRLTLAQRAALRADNQAQLERDPCRSRGDRCRVDPRVDLLRAIVVRGRW